jgi:hypothetical protein
MDGKPGYGGVFTEEFLGFSQHTPGRSFQGGEPNPLFDEIFDPLRPDIGGIPVRLEDLEGDGPPTVRDGSFCPAEDRPTRIACAIYVLGNLIGTTMTHEVGHSLGLAVYRGERNKFHNANDGRNRLMDSGGDRPFEERSELSGFGPAAFCDEDYDYLRNDILKGSSDPDPLPRPGGRERFARRSTTPKQRATGAPRDAPPRIRRVLSQRHLRLLLRRCSTKIGGAPGRTSIAQSSGSGKGGSKVFGFSRLVN